MSMNIDLSNRCVLVTGATGELGRVMCRTLADSGADVAVHYLKNETAAAALVMRALDEEIRTKTDNDASLDTLVGNLLEKSRTVTNAGFRAAAEDLVGRPVEALADCP